MPKNKSKKDLEELELEEGNETKKIKIDLPSPEVPMEVEDTEAKKADKKENEANSLEKKMEIEEQKEGEVSQNTSSFSMLTSSKDVFFHVVDYLSLSDVNSLSLTNKKNHELIKNYTNTNPKKILEKFGICFIKRTDSLQFNYPLNIFNKINIFIQRILQNPQSSISTIARLTFDFSENDQSALACYLKALQLIGDSSKFQEEIFTLLNNADAIINAIFLKFFLRMVMWEHHKKMGSPVNILDKMKEKIISDAKIQTAESQTSAVGVNATFLLELFEKKYNFKAVLAFCMNPIGYRSIHASIHGLIAQYHQKYCLKLNSFSAKKLSEEAIKQSFENCLVRYFYPLINIDGLMLKLSFDPALRQKLSAVESLLEREMIYLPENIKFLEQPKNIKFLHSNKVLLFIWTFLTSESISQNEKTITLAIKRLEFILQKNVEYIFYVCCKDPNAALTSGQSFDSSKLEPLRKTLEYLLTVDEQLFMVALYLIELLKEVLPPLHVAYRMEVYFNDKNNKGSKHLLEEIDKATETNEKRMLQALYKIITLLNLQEINRSGNPMEKKIIGMIKELIQDGQLGKLLSVLKIIAAPNSQNFKLTMPELDKHRLATFYNLTTPNGAYGNNYLFKWDKLPAEVIAYAADSRNDQVKVLKTFLCSEVYISLQGFLPFISSGWISMEEFEARKLLSQTYVGLINYLLLVRDAWQKEEFRQFFRLEKRADGKEFEDKDYAIMLDLFNKLPLHYLNSFQKAEQVLTYANYLNKLGIQVKKENIDILVEYFEDNKIEELPKLLNAAAVDADADAELLIGLRKQSSGLRM